jgi:hypothetical protein
VPRPPRGRRPPGVVHVSCTGRGKHSRVPFRSHLRMIRPGDGQVRVMWNRRQGPGPVTGFGAADGLDTYEIRCRTCSRHFKCHEDRLGVIIAALAEHQGIRGDDNRPIVLDISLIERA